MRKDLPAQDFCHRLLAPAILGRGAYCTQTLRKLATESLAVCGLTANPALLAQAEANLNLCVDPHRLAILLARAETPLLDRLHGPFVQAQP